MNFPFSIFFIAYFATFSLLNEYRLNFTPATLLKFVLTGPGHNTLTLTFEFFTFNSF